MHPDTEDFFARWWRDRMRKECVRLNCGAIFTVGVRDDISFAAPANGPTFATLDDLPVPSQEDADLIMKRPGATGQAWLAYATLDYTSRMVMSGIELTHEESMAIMGGADPLAVLLPPGRLVAVPVNMDEIVLEAQMREIFR